MWTPRAPRGIPLACTGSGGSPRNATREAEASAIATDACADATRPLLDRIDELEARVDQLEGGEHASAGDAFRLESRFDDKRGGLDGRSLEQDPELDPPSLIGRLA